MVHSRFPMDRGTSVIHIEPFSVAKWQNINVEKDAFLMWIFAFFSLVEGAEPNTYVGLVEVAEHNILHLFVLHLGK